MPVADYRLTHNIAAVEPVGKGEAAAEGVEASEGSPHRGVFSFCMCPGGQIVPTSIDPEEVCVNGMSFSKRRSVESTSNQRRTIERFRCVREHEPNMSNVLLSDTTVMKDTASNQWGEWCTGSL